MLMSLVDEVDELAASDSSKATITRLLRELDKAKTSKEDLIAAVYQAVSDNVNAITFRSVPKPTVNTKSRRHEETAIICFSDLQLGQVTASYSTAVAEERVHRYADKIEKLVAIQRADHPIHNAKLYMLGDLVEGELIFPHQPFQIDQSLFSQSIREGPRIVSDFIRRMLGIFDGRIDVVSVPGNHGDVGGGSRKAYNPETNFDRILSSVVEQLFDAAGERRVTFRVPAGYGQTSFYAVDYVGDVGFMLWHGHQARRSSNSSHLPFYKLVLGWRAGAIPEPFRYSICGHHHVPTMLPMGAVTHFINGTFASDAEYAIERFASNSGPTQWLLFAMPGRGLTAQYPVSLED